MLQMEAVKAFLKRYTTSKVSQRKQLFANLNTALNSGDLPAPVVKLLVHSLGNTLFRYGDRTSRLLVEDSLNKLCAVYAGSAVQSLGDVLQECSSYFMVDSPSVSLAKSSLTALRWSCILFTHCKEVSLANVQCQATLLTGVSNTMATRGLWKLAVKQLHTLWRSKEGLAEECMSCLLSGDSHFPSLVMLGCLSEFISKKGALTMAQQDAMLVYYSKTVLSSRMKPPHAVVKSCAAIFKRVTHKQFSSILLSSTLKCLLRNPDELLEAVGVMVSVLPIDCSQYAVDLMKNTVVHLSSNQPASRQYSLELVAALSLQCSDFEPVKQLFQQLFNALKSSPSGKLTVAEHRTSVLSAIESLSKCPLSSSSQQQLSTIVCEGLINFITQEVHTGTAVCAASVLRTWCLILPDNPPKTLVEHFKSALSTKGTASQLRIAYMHCILAVCQGERKALSESYQPLFVKILETVSSASSPPQAVLEEALVASHVLIRTSYPGPIPSAVWSLLDNHTELLLSVKLMSVATQQSLLVVVHVAAAVLCAEEHSLKEHQQREWLSAVVQVMMQSSWETQRVAATCLSRVVTKNPQWALVLLEIVEEIEKKGEFPPKRLLLATISLALPTHPQREDIAVKSLAILHHPDINSVCPTAWVDLLKRLNLDPRALISNQADVILKSLTDMMSTKEETCYRSLATLLIFGPDFLVPKIVDDVCVLLGNRELMEVTEEQMEILTTPPGELWHSGMRKELESALSGSVEIANMKRESKAYSYEDQKWEMEVRQEMLKRKKAQSEGQRRDIRTAIKEAKLSQKQQQAIEAQLAYEEEVHEKLAKLDARLTNMVDIVKTTKGEMIVEHVPRLSKAVISSLHSPLATQHCQHLWSVMAHSVFREWTLAQLFVVTSFKALSSPASLHTIPALPKLLPLIEHHTSTSHMLTNMSYSLTLTLLHVILMSHDSSHDPLKEVAVSVLCKAIRDYTKSHDTLQPSEFPAEDTLKLLSSIIAMETDTTREMKMKNSCVEAFVSLLPHVHTQVIHFLTSCLLSPAAILRLTSLRAVASLDPASLPSDSQLLVALLVARYDPEEESRIVAERLWESSGYGNSLTADLAPILISLASSNNLTLQSSVAQALEVWLEVHRTKAGDVLHQLIEMYHKRRTVPPPKKDSFGRELFIDYHDPWESRMGVAKAMEHVPKFVEPSLVMEFLQFVLPGALSDSNSNVQDAIMTAAKVAISTHGEELAGELMAHFEHCLQSAGDTHEADTVRQFAVVLMGNLAKHMDKKNPKVKSVVHLLLGNLDTPSQPVQEAIANCLPPLASVIKPDAEDIIKKLLDKLQESTSYSQRKGAAYGLAGLVKGLGIPTLKQHRVMQTLQEAIKDKKNYRHRESALFAFESLCNMLGRLFEPYVVHLLPDLLICFGDGNQYVREATDKTARTIMTHLSSHGVKLILPSLLSALEEDSWRTKAGSAELLGAMAYCAPKQLSSCLPSIVPRLMDVLTDSHSKVQVSGSQALKQIGSVIKNPEIQVLVPVLLDALGDPSNKAQTCLQALLDTEFIHVIDPPSLALIMPTLKRALEIRSTDTKKMTAQIIGNMYSLTDKKDLAPYINDVLPGLKQSLVDPVPEVRSVCARALGAMARGMGDKILEELLPWLLETLQSESSSVDRSGAAQGLSEVLFAQGVEHLTKLMPQFITSIQDVELPTHVRDGYIMMFVYLPVTFGDQFVEFIGDILQCILKGLADESEFVRDTALQAGQTIVNRYAAKAVELFLPELEAGLFDENWRIRCSSVQLLGDLLYKISGLSGKMSTESEEDDNFGTEEAHQSILKCLGRERRNRVLAGLYMGRSDVALMVRQASLHVWKVVVTNTARALREILPTLIHLLLGCLASESHDKRKVAARTLGDLVRKLGERVLPEVIPMLEQGLGSKDMQERQGVCIGLSEIIQQTSRDHVLVYVDSLLPTVCNALRDQEQEVRAAAAMTFDSLHSTVGPRILDEVLTPLLSDLSSSSEKSEVALDGLKQVMAVKSRVVLPHIIPQLVKPPVNIRALALLSSVAGEALHKHLVRIIPALIVSLVSNENEDDWQSAEGVILSVQNEPGPSYLIEELTKSARSTKPETRIAAMGLMLALCSKAQTDITEHVPQLMIFTTESLNDPVDLVCERAWLALDAIVKRVNQKELPHYTGYLRKALRMVSTNLCGDELHGFALKGIGPALAILKVGLISGSPDEKEEAARVLVEVIHLASSKTLSTGKVVMLIAGPLIRVLGDRYGWSVKVATLEALVQLVRKVGAAAKSFIPQLQTSYLKALNDPNPPVRTQAVTGLTELLPLSPRVDPVFNELHNGVKKNEEPGLRQTMLQALHGAIKAAGQRMSEKHGTELLSTLVALQATAHEGHRLESSCCVGALCAFISDEELLSLFQTSLLEREGVSDWAVLQARATSLSSALTIAPTRIIELGLRERVAAAVSALATSDRIPVCESGLKSARSFVNHIGGDVSLMVPLFCQGLAHSSTDIKIVSCDMCADLQSPPDSLLCGVFPLLLNNTRERNTAVRAASEKAIVQLVHGDQHLKHCIGMLDVSTGKHLEDVYTRVRAKLSRDM